MNTSIDALPTGQYGKSRPGGRLNLRVIDWIWHIRGSLPLVPDRSNDEVFARLEPLFGQRGTHHELTQDTLVFSKRDQAAQDKMSIFDGGTLRIENGGARSVLRYHLTSRALLGCFLAPLLFVAIAQLTVALGRFQHPAGKIETKSGKASGKQKPASLAVVPQNPIDKALGAPAPEKPGKDGADGPGKGKKPSPTPAYVFAALFAILYVVGRILEDRLVRTLFKKSLAGA